MHHLLMSPEESGAHGFPRKHHTSESSSRQLYFSDLPLPKVNLLKEKWYQMEIELYGTWVVIPKSI